MIYIQIGLCHIKLLQLGFFFLFTQQSVDMRHQLLASHICGVLHNYLWVDERCVAPFAEAARNAVRLLPSEWWVHDYAPRLRLRDGYAILQASIIIAHCTR